METRFNRNLKVFVVAILALIMSLFLFDSCNQEEFAAPKMKIKIFVSSSPSNDGLKSAALTTEVAIGDTVVQTRDINILMWAVDENGQPISGFWKLEVAKTDYSQMTNIRPLNPAANFTGDQIAYRFNEIGLYKVTFGTYKQATASDPEQINAQIVFYVRIYGNPGKVGDDADHNYIFRLENKSVYDLEAQKPKNLAFAYFKFEAAQNMNPEQAYVRFTDFQKDGSELTKMIHLMRWPFSRDYYYFTIEKSETSLGRYRLLYLISDTRGFMGVVDNNNYLSGWTNGINGIEFAVQ